MLAYLLSCAVNQTECKLDPDEIDFDGLYSLAKNQVLCSAVAFALESAGISERRFEQAKLKAKRRLGLFDVERQKIYGSLKQSEFNKLTRQLDGRDTKSAKAKHIFDRVFLRGDELKECYPFFGDHKWLLPFLYVYRSIKGLFTHPKKSFMTPKTSRSIIRRKTAFMTIIILTE